MEEGWTSMTDPKEKKRIQNRVAQRVYREKLKSRIRELEERLESVAGASTQNDASTSLSSYDDPILSFAMPGVLPTTNSKPISDRPGATSSDIMVVGNQASKSPMGSNAAAESCLNTTPQNSIVAQQDLTFQTPLEVQPVDLNWLLTGFGSSRTVLERTTPMEGGHKTPDHSPNSPSVSLPQHRGSSEYAPVGGNSGQPAHKATTAPMARNTNTVHETLPRPDITILERLSLLVEYSRRLGFSNLNEALTIYYTSDLSKSAILSHEQSLNRVRQLPSFISNIREHSKHWPMWERANYMKEMLRSAEDIYAEECRVARMNLANQGITGPTQKEFQADEMFQITRVLQKEDRLNTVGPYQEHLYRHVGAPDDEFDLLR
ncbi:hypothetical protein S40288_11556 [Stachybotrys chartarum IBT 40288]|nr:hypothetical protein S40288_11556 [Stachybotrys chartarum IBT 40288]